MSIVSCSLNKCEKKVDTSLEAEEDYYPLFASKKIIDKQENFCSDNCRLIFLMED